MRARRREDRAGNGAINAIKIAGLGAAIVLFLAVAVGFRSEEFAALLSRLQGLGFLVEPLLLGVSLLEALAFVLVVALGYWVIRRG